MRTEKLSRIGQAFRERKLIDEALKVGAREALLLHKRNELPVVIYRAGQVVWVLVQELEEPGQNPGTSKSILL